MKKWKRYLIGLIILCLFLSQVELGLQNSVHADEPEEQEQRVVNIVITMGKRMDLRLENLNLNLYYRKKGETNFKEVDLRKGKGLFNADDGELYEIKACVGECVLYEELVKVENDTTILQWCIGDQVEEYSSKKNVEFKKNTPYRMLKNTKSKVCIEDGSDVAGCIESKKYTYFFIRKAGKFEWSEGNGENSTIVTVNKGVNPDDIEFTKGEGMVQIITPKLSDYQNQFTIGKVTVDDEINSAIAWIDNNQVKINKIKILDSAKIEISGTILENERYQTKKFSKNIVVGWEEGDCNDTNKGYQIQEKSFDGGWYKGEVNIKKEREKDVMYEWTENGWMSVDEIKINLKKNGKMEVPILINDKLYKEVVWVDNQEPKFQYAISKKGYKEDKVQNITTGYYGDEIDIIDKSIDSESGIANQIITLKSGESKKFVKVDSTHYHMKSPCKVQFIYKLKDKVGNITMGTIPYIFIVDTTVPPAPTPSFRSKGADYNPGSWTKDDVTIDLQLKGDDVPFSGIESFQYTTKDPKKCKDDDWNIIKVSENKVIDDSKPMFMNKNDVVGGLTLSSHTCETYYFRTISQTGIKSKPTKGYNICIQKDQLQNGSVKISNRNMGKQDWYTSKPEIEVNHPSLTSYSEKHAPVITHYQLLKMEKNDYEIVEEKEFQRGSIREHIAKENVINPQIIKDGKYKIAVWTSDTCGNQTTPIYKEFKVDTNAPSGLAIVFHKSIESGFIKEILSDMGIWAIFQDFARYECEATDEEMEFPGSGVEKLEYSTDQQNWIQVENNSFQLLSNYMGKIYLRATDKAGNVSTPSDKIIGKDIDTDSISPTSLIVDGEKPGKPVIIATSGKGSYTEDTWTNQAVQINVTSKVPLSGIDYYEYTTKKNAKESDWKKLNQTTNTQIHMDQKVGMIQDRITISKDENATYYFRAVSNSKKYSDVAGIHVKIQLTKPSIAVVRLTPATPDGDNGWYAKKKPKIMIEHNQKTGKSNEDAAITTSYKLWNTTKGQTEAQAKLNEYIEGKAIPSQTITEDGIYYLKVWARDEAGNEYLSREKNKYDLYTIKVDTTNPKGAVTIGTEKYNRFSRIVDYVLNLNQKVAIQMDAQDELSGIERIEYQKVKDASQYDPNGEWKRYQKFMTAKNERFIVYLRVKDKAGNQIVVNSDGVIVDTKKPTGKNRQAISIVPIGLNEHGIANKNFAVDIIVKDPDYFGVKSGSRGVHSGLKKVNYSISVDGKVKKKSTLFQDNRKKVAYKKLKRTFVKRVKINAKEMEGKQVQFIVHAADRAGNEAINQETMKVDVTRPKIKISYDNNKVFHDKYYSADRNLNININEINFNGNDVVFTIKKNGKTMEKKLLHWKKLNDHQHVASYPISMDGDYEVTASYTDQGGNDAKYSKVDRFIIDKTEPELAFHLDNAQGVKESYYHTNLRGDVEVKDTNFQNNMKLNITVLRDGKKVKVPKLGTWKRSGDTYKAPVLFDQEGDYKIEGSCMDAANNERKLTAVQFHIDKNAPEIKIQGIKSGSSNLDQLKPQIEISDLYEKENGVKITLQGINRGKIPLSVVPTKDKHTMKYLLDVFPRKKSIDDVYLLTVSSEDKAGNKTTKKLNFSVNRFGSVYSYDTNTAAIRNQFKTKAQEVVITETNVDYLSKYYVKVSCNDVVKDLIEKKDYDVEVSGKKNGYKQYQYKIRPEVFENDGYYSVHVYSKDKAANESDNQSKKMECSFVIDKTEPLCVVTGVESGKSYNAKEKNVRVTVSDNTYMNKLIILKNGRQITSLDKEQIDKCKGQVSVKLDGSNEEQILEVTCIDAAGNQKIKTISNVLVTTNPVVRFINNSKLVYCSIFGIAGMLSLLVLVLFHKKKEEAA